MRIAVYGAGGIGGFMGARLWQAGHDVALIALGEHLKAIQSSGLWVEAPDGNFTVTPRIATDDPAKVGEVDLVILGVKAWQVPEAARALLPMVGPETRVMTIQNGVEAPYQVAEIVPAELVIAGVMYFQGILTGPGRLQCTNPGVIDSYVGQLAPIASGRTEAVAQAHNALQTAGFRVVAPEDIRTPAWRKFIGGSARVGVEALTRAPLGGWRSVPAARDLYGNAAQEIIAIARSRDITIGDDMAEFLFGAIDQYPANHRTSAVRDVLAGRPSEIDAMTGAVIRLGRAAGVPTPVNEFIYAALLPQELKARGQIAWPE